MLTKFPRLATSGCHNCAMITDRPKLTAKIVLFGCLVAILTLESIQSLFTGLYGAYKKSILPTFSASSDVRYWVNSVRRCSCLAADMQEKQTELEIESK